MHQDIKQENQEKIQKQCLYILNVVKEFNKKMDREELNKNKRSKTARLFSVSILTVIFID